MDIVLSGLSNDITNIKARFTGDTRNLVVSYSGTTTDEFAADGGEMPIGSDITSQLIATTYAIKAADGTEKAVAHGALTKPAGWTFIEFSVDELGYLGVTVVGNNPLDLDNYGTVEFEVKEDGYLYGDFDAFNEYLTSMWDIHKWSNAKLKMQNGKIIQTK